MCADLAQECLVEENERFASEASLAYVRYQKQFDVRNPNPRLSGNGRYRKSGGA